MTPYNTDISETTERLAARVHDVNVWAQYYIQHAGYAPALARLMGMIAAHITPQATVPGLIIMPYTTTLSRDNADMSRNYSHIGHY